MTSQCNKVIRSSGTDWYPWWRNNHYIVDLDELLEISKKRDSGDSIESGLTFLSKTSDFEVISPSQPNLDSPASWSSMSDGVWTPQSSPSSAMSWKSMGSSKRPEFSTRPTSLATLSQASISPTSIAPDTPATVVERCPACRREFRGSPQDARSNLLRHLRTTKRHNIDAGLKCPQPECRTRRSMRSDNLKPHLKKVHPELSSSKRQDIIDESKSLARRRDSHENL